MHHVNLKVLVVILFSFFQAGVFAQGSREEVSRISKYYKDHKSFLMTVKYIMYETATSMIPADNYSAQLYQRSEDYIYDIQGIRHIRTGNTFIEIDTSDKVIAIGNQNKESITPGFQIDSMFKYFTAKSLKTVPENGEGKMVLTPNGFLKENGQFSKVEMYYNSKYYVTRLVFYYAMEVQVEEDNPKTSKARLEILYGNPEKLPANSDAMFLKNTYYQEKGKALTASGIYKNYKVYDTRIKIK
jgi:hypothetical protein